MVLRYTSVITLVQVDKIEGEEMNTTAGRFKIALNNIVLEKQLFWRIVKQIRRDAN